VYDLAEYNIGKKLIDLSSTNIKCALFSSSSNANNVAISPATFATLTNELPTANGYTAGGVAVTASWTNSDGTTGRQTFSVSNPTWTPTGPGIISRYAVLYDSVTGYLICFTTLDNTPADVSVTSLTINSAGVFTMQRA
jgi:hypothetical protein